MSTLIKLSAFSLLLLVIGFSFPSCNNVDNGNAPSNGQFGIFRVIDDTTIEMNGTINGSTLRDFNRLLEVYSDIKLIKMDIVPGSEDDIINLQVAKRVFDLNIDTHLMDNGEIASGGVDFFLAGVNRSIGNNTRIGVHSWSDGRQEATDFPVGHENHQLYIDFYFSIGFTQQEAEAFYYFTINAAQADDIHWMTEAEILQYKIITQ